MGRAPRELQLGAERGARLSVAASGGVRGCGASRFSSRCHRAAQDQRPSATPCGRSRSSSLRVTGSRVSPRRVWAWGGGRISGPRPLPFLLVHERAELLPLLGPLHCFPGLWPDAFHLLGPPGRRTVPGT